MPCCANVVIASVTPDAVKTTCFFSEYPESTSRLKIHLDDKYGELCHGYRVLRVSGLRSGIPVLLQARCATVRPKLRCDLPELLACNIPTAKTSPILCGIAPSVLM